MTCSFLFFTEPSLRQVAELKSKRAVKLIAAAKYFAATNSGGKRHGKDRATAGRIGMRDCAAVGAGERLHEDKAKAKTGWRVDVIAAREWTEETPPHVSRYTWTMIEYGQSDRVVDRLDGYLNRPVVA